MSVAVAQRPMILNPGLDLTLRPMRYPVFYEMYKAGIRNTWSVEEVDFSSDLVDLRSRLLPSERHLVHRLVAFFATGDSMAAVIANQWGEADSLQKSALIALAVIVAASLACFSWFGVDAAQEVTADTRLLAVATYVAIGFDGGGGFTADVDAGKTPGVSQEDRAALVSIRTQFEKWHRYVLTDFPDRADLLVAVRAGRRGYVGGQTAVGGRPPGTGLKAADAGVSSTDDDMLSVYTNTPAGGRRTRALVWRRALSEGLSGSPAPLFEQFRAAVEAAAR
jgi:hypothetical protein